MSISSIRAARELEQARGDGQRQQVDQQKSIRQEIGQQANSGVDRKRNLRMEIAKANKALADAEAEEETKRRKAGRVQTGASLTAGLTVFKTAWDIGEKAWNQGTDNNKLTQDEFNNPNSDQGTQLRIASDLKKNHGVEVDPGKIEITKRHADGSVDYKVKGTDLAKPVKGSAAVEPGDKAPADVTGTVKPFRVSAGDEEVRSFVMARLKEKGLKVGNPEKDIEITRGADGKISYTAKTTDSQGTAKTETGTLDAFPETGGKKFVRCVVMPVFQGLADNLDAWKAVTSTAQAARDANDQLFAAVQRKNNAKKHLAELKAMLNESASSSATG